MLQQECCFSVQEHNIYFWIQLKVLPMYFSMFYILQKQTMFASIQASPLVKCMLTILKIIMKKQLVNENKPSYILGSPKSKSDLVYEALMAMPKPQGDGLSKADIKMRKNYNKIHSGTMDKVIDKTTPKLRDILASRLQEEPYGFKPSEVAGGGGSRFWGLPLPLLPDISLSSVEVGEEGSLLKLYGIKQREGTIVQLAKGPNRKANRYLKFQYIRLLESLGGTIFPEDNSKTLHDKTIFGIGLMKAKRKVGWEPPEDDFGRKIMPPIY